MKKLIFISILFAAFSFVSKSEIIDPERNFSADNSSFSSFIQLQDTIFKRNGEKIICAVKEIGTSEIKYINKEYNAELLFSILKNDIEKITYSDGKVQVFEYQPVSNENIEQNSQELFQAQKKNALKFDFISLVNNTFCLTYERCLKPARSLEFSLGVVGFGIAKKDDNASGILFRGGYKLIRSPEFYMKGMRYAHIMKGPYLKLEFDFASYGIEGYKDLFDSEREKYTLTKWGLLMVFGNQWVFNDNFVVDFYTGLGIGKNNMEDLDWTYPYGFTTFGDGFPLAMSMGLRIGFLLK